MAVRRSLAVLGAATAAVVVMGAAPEMDEPLPWLSPQNAPAVPGTVFVADNENAARALPAPWNSVEAADYANSIKVTDQIPARLGQHSLKFTLKQGDMVYGGNRAQVTHNLKDHAGTQGWYAWSVMIPDDYPSDKDAGHWQILAEFKDQPDKNKGETWQDWPDHRPSVAMYYVETDQPGLAFRYGVNSESPSWNYGPVPIKKGQWTDVYVNVGWSTGDDGYVESWVGDKAATPKDDPEGASRYKGRTMYYDYTNMLKLGLFRSADIQGTATLYFDEVRTGRTRQNVTIPTNNDGHKLKASPLLKPHNLLRH